MISIIGVIIKIFVLAIVVIGFVSNNIKVVPQANAYVVERLGTYKETWGVGLHFKVPFIDKIAKLCEDDGKTVTISGNDKYVSDSKVEKADNADVIIDVAVPAQVTSELSSLDVQTMLNKKDTIAIFGTNQHSSEGMVTGNENLNKFGPDDDQVIAIGFDSSEVINNAVKSGEFIGAITQAPVKIGETVVELCVKTANGEDVSDVDTGCQWFTADNMEDKEIAENLIE
jgi:ribose transport system substrate-binding protein